MDIQELLGIEIVDEKEQQKKILYNRISRNIQFQSDRYLNLPYVPDVPSLSSQSIHDLATELAQRAKECQKVSTDMEVVAKPHIQLNFLRFLNCNDMKCNDKRKKKTVTRNDSSNNSSDIVRNKTRKLNTQPKVQTSRSFGWVNKGDHSKSSTFLRHGSITIQNKDHFDKSIDQLMEEALQDNIINQRNMLTMSGEELDVVPSHSVNSVNEKDQDSIICNSTQSTKKRQRRSSNENVKERKASKLRRKSETESIISTEDSERSGTQCPVCQKYFQINRDEVDSFMDKHVSHCLRRQDQNVPKRKQAQAGQECHLPTSNRDSAERFVDHAEQVSQIITCGRSIKYAQQSSNVDGVDISSEEDECSLYEEEMFPGDTESTDDDDYAILKDDELTEKSSSRRCSREGKVKSKDVTVHDDWEDMQFLQRLSVYEEELQAWLIEEEITREMAASEPPEVEVEELEEGEEREDFQPSVVKNQHQFQEVEGNEYNEETVEMTRIHKTEGVFVTEFGSAVDQRSWDVLYLYQKRGVEWLWKHYDIDGSGGILGDEM